MIDSHCHLNFQFLKENFSQIIDNAINNDITSILSINTDPKDFDDHLELIANYHSIFISYGLHPENVSKSNNINKNNIIEKCNNNKVIGIGETGLDFYHSTEFIKEQYISFEKHIEASINTNLPLILHQRNSEKEIMDILYDYKKKYNFNAVFHCFTGTSKLKNFCLENEFLISISGIITFKNAIDLRKTILDIPLNSLLLETDSPFLSPEPVRGKINEPFHVNFIAKYLANFLNIPIDILIMNTDNNFYKLFSKAIKYNKIHK